MTAVVAGLDLDDLRRVVDAALAEDLRYGPDVTTAATVPADAVAIGAFATRKPGVLAGLPAVRAVLDTVIGTGGLGPGGLGAGGRGTGGLATGGQHTRKPETRGHGAGRPGTRELGTGVQGTGGLWTGGYEVLDSRADGDRLAAGDVVLTVRAPVRGLLTAERTALNLLCHLSGVATATAAWVDAVAGTPARIRDTRKTLPGLRLLEKYAVRCGGGVNHRLGLGDAVLIKDNHVVAAGSVGAALAAARALAPDLPYEVEVDSLEQLDEVLALHAELVLLDNFPVDRTAEAVRRRGSTPTLLESSGGLTLAHARAYAETGVDYISVGALTHSVTALDLGLDLVPE